MPMTKLLAESDIKSKQQMEKVDIQTNICINEV
jgi:hypothetical protein